MYCPCLLSMPRISCAVNLNHATHPKNTAVTTGRSTNVRLLHETSKDDAEPTDRFHAALREKAPTFFMDCLFGAHVYLFNSTCPSMRPLPISQIV